MTSGVQLASTHVKSGNDRPLSPWSLSASVALVVPGGEDLFWIEKESFMEMCYFFPTAWEQIEQCTQSCHKETVLSKCLVPKETRVLSHHRLQPGALALC